MFEAFTEESEQTVTIVFEGSQLVVPAGITVAAAVMAYTKHNYIRLSPVSGEKRAPFCFMGVCHECLMEINGMSNQQACILEVSQGMRVNLQTAPEEASQ